MKILGVRFKNLNSLMGEWHIDFTQPEYESNGIFAITGPTGAGKTTIMDAVCLGLYGRTPRLDKVTKSSNEIMSRQTGECFAEVEFETQKGRYRCHWSQRRAKKRPDGELQQAKHEIADVDSGEILESRITQVSKFIDNATGMDFDRFTRSMLLAQGGFSAFLQAPTGERADILEQITGTEIYSRISVKVHERRTEERDKLELLQAELKGIQVLSAGEERYLQKSLGENREQETELAVKVTEMRKSLIWLDGMETLEKELSNLDEQRQNLEKRRQDYKPESIKLERAHKALSLEGDYRGLHTLRTQQLNEIRELNLVTIELPKREKSATDALVAKQATERHLNVARKAQISETEVLKKVRELDTKLGEQERQLGEKDKAIEEIEKQGKIYTSNIKSCEKELNKSQAALETVHAFQTQHIVDSTLQTNFTAIERGLETLRDLELKFIKDQNEFTAETGKKESALAACSKTEADHEKIRHTLEKEQNELTSLNNEISTILKGRDISQWRSDIDTLKDREVLLTQTGEIFERIDKTSTERNSLKKCLDILIADQKKYLNGIKLYEHKKVLLEKSTGRLEAEVTRFNHIRSLEEERKQLEDGNPCPLCGAMDHPYAQGNIPVFSDAETELKNTKDELKIVTEELSKLGTEQIKATAEIQHAEKEMAEKKATLDSDEKKCAAALSRLKMQVSTEARVGKVDEEIKRVQEEFAEISGMIAMAEKKSKKEKSTQQGIEKMRVTFDDSGKLLYDAKIALEKAVLAYERMIKDCATLTEEIKKARTVVLKDIELFGIMQIPSSSIDDILKDLRARKDDWKVKEEEKIVHEKKINNISATIQKNQALLNSLMEDMKVRGKDRDDLKIEYESLSTSRWKLFGEKNADQEEKRLADALVKAEGDFEKAREEYVQMEKEISALKEKLSLLGKNTEKRATELAQAEHKMHERFMTTGFKDEGDYLSARLSEEERKILAEKEDSLFKEKTEFDARIKDKSEALTSERGKELTDQSREDLQKAVSALESKLQQIMLDMGGIIKSLSENEKLREKLQERIKAIESQKMESVRWENLHLLIGSADGKKFRNFAQGLTFEMMTAYANRQLKKMTDRYLLIHDALQPLELNVIDSYQAGEIRSTKNLSGGESFIVSLALALGLSHMASRNVRVDSLFLDEGFGTLDEDALETALETLSSLQQEGKLIGIISHVTALKDRISTQIQVIPHTGGRSSLRGPGCRKI